MTEPRFVVRECHGQRFSNRPDPVVAYVVLDRADCYRRVVELTGQGGYGLQHARLRAAELAERLNEDGPTGVFRDGIWPDAVTSSCAASEDTCGAVLGDRPEARP